MPENRQPIYDALIKQGKTAEAADCKKLHEAVDDENRNFSDLMCAFITMDATSLKHCGHKSVESALLSGTQAHLKKCRKLVADHIKKYPD